MPNVTVLGAAGTTVTIPFTSTLAAAAAQSALGAISAGVLAGTFTQVNYTGSSTLPATPTTAGAGIVEQGTSSVPLAPVALGGYVSAILDGAAQQVLLTGLTATSTVVSGAAGAVVENYSSSAKVYFGGGNNAFAEANPLTGIAASATVFLDGNATFDVSSGSTTINASGANTINLINTGTGAALLNLTATSGAPYNVFISGNTNSADTINAAGAPLVVSQNGGKAVINAGASNVTLFGGGAAGGIVTLFGGSGTDIVSQGIGVFQAGTGGNSNIVGGAAAPSTIAGGGVGDTIAATAAKSLLVASNIGSETLQGGAANGAGVTFIGVSSTPAINTMVTTFLGPTLGGATFAFGLGTTAISMFGGTQNGNFVVEQFGGGDNVALLGMISGKDTFSLQKPGGGTYQLIFGSPAAPNGSQMTVNYTSTVFGPSTTIKLGDGTNATAFGTLLVPTDFR